MGDHKELRVVSLFTYVWNCCVMKILYIYMGVFIGNDYRELCVCQLCPGPWT